MVCGFVCIQYFGFQGCLRGVYGYKVCCTVRCFTVGGVLQCRCRHACVGCSARRIRRSCMACRWTSALDFNGWYDLFIGF